MEREIQTISGYQEKTLHLTSGFLTEKLSQGLTCRYANTYQETVFDCLWLSLCVCVCECVYVWERKRGREREQTVSDESE